MGVTNRAILKVATLQLKAEQEETEYAEQNDLNENGSAKHVRVGIEAEGTDTPKQ